MADQDLVPRVCPDAKCGVPYAIPRHIYEQAKSLGEKRTYYCPNGHAAILTETNEDRLVAKVEQLQKDIVYLNTHINVVCGERNKANVTARYWRGIAHRKSKVARG